MKNGLPFPALLEIATGERDDCTRGCGIAQPVQYHWRTIMTDLLAKSQFENHGIHARVRLMQPEAPHIVRGQIVMAQELDD